MASTVQILQGINYTTYVSDLTSLMSTYNNSLCYIESTTPQGARSVTSAMSPLGFGFIPDEPEVGSLTHFEGTKTYYVQARVPFTLNLPGNQTKLNQWFDILPPKLFSPPGGGEAYYNSYKYNIGFDHSIARTPISACITPTTNRSAFVISRRIPASEGVAVYIGVYDEPGQDQTQQQLTHFEPGSSYSVLIFGNLPSTTRISVNRTSNTSYLLTDDLRFLTTNAGDYIRV